MRKKVRKQLIKELEQERCKLMDKAKEFNLLGNTRAEIFTRGESNGFLGAIIHINEYYRKKPKKQRKNLNSNSNYRVYSHDGLEHPRVTKKFFKRLIKIYKRENLKYTIITHSKIKTFYDYAKNGE